MRLLWALSAALILAITLGLVVGGPGAARAQSVDEAEQSADDARRRAERASSLLTETASVRAGVEDELAASLTRLAQLNAELSRVANHLDDLRQALGRADTDLATLSESLTLQAVDAYVRAVTMPAATVIGTSNAEAAIVASTSIESSIGADQAEVSHLTVQRRELQRLREEYLAEQEHVAELQREADAEAEHLEALLAEADTELAAATAAARRADAQYRAALDAVDSARAREEERRRQQQRTTTTTSTTAPPTTSPPGPGTTTTSPPPPVSGGDFPPAVERWRPLVTTYFPPARVDEALSVIRCESHGDPDAYNPYSGASGLFQFLPSTWAAVSPRAGFGGAGVFDPEANIGTAAWLTDYYAGRGSDPWSAWVCRP